MATIVRRQGPNGQLVYRVQVRRKGAPSLSATFPTRAKARKWAQITEAAILEGRHFPTSEAKRHTLAEAIDRYLVDVLPHKSASSIEMQTIQLQWWRRRLGHSRLADLTPSLIAEHRDRLAQGSGRRRKNSTVRRYLAALSHVLTIAAKEWQWLDDSPMRQVTKPKEPRGRVRFLADDERQRLLTACQASRNPYLYLVVVLGLSTGARKGDCSR
jgi:integrase